MTQTSQGTIKLTFDTSIPQGKEWTGTITILKFKALATGTATVTITYAIDPMP